MVFRLVTCCGPIVGCPREIGKSSGRAAIASLSQSRRQAGRVKMEFGNVVSRDYPVRFEAIRRK